MAGTGQRFASDLPKQYHLLGGKRLYLHTLERFIEANLFDEIILVCEPSRCEEVQSEVALYPRVRAIRGGVTRQESSYLGLIAAGSETKFVVIHDAVRPFVSIEILSANLEGARRHGAVDTCIASADTLVHAPDGKKIADIPPRAHYFRGQTPQSFSYPLILEAHEQARKKGLTSQTDDCSLALALGATIHIVEGDERNLKITSQLDLALVSFHSGGR